MASTRPEKSVNGWPWAGRPTVTPSSLRHAVQRVEEHGQRVVGAGLGAGDVGCDRGQDVIARQHDALHRIEQAQVVDGVTRRVQCHPLPAGEPDDLARLRTGGWAAGC